MNAQGLPVNLNGLGWKVLVDIPSNDYYSGDWIIDWIGETTVGLSSSSTVSGANNGVNGRWVVTCTSDTPTFSITAINYPANPLIQLRMYRADHEADLLAGHIYTPLYRAKISKAGVWRPMDYQLANLTNVGKWEDSTPVDYFSYACSHWEITKDAGSTTHSGDNYTCSLIGYVRSDKSKLHVKWNFTNTTTTPTIDDGFGAKTIKSPRGAALAVGALVSGRRDTLTYDEGLDCYLNTALTGVIEFDEGIIAGIPPAVLIRLANDTGAHLDLSIPPMACDTLTGITDYAPSLAALCRTNLNSGLKPKPQIGNELFNTAAGFHCGPYATAKGTARWGAGNPNENWHGRALALVGAAFSSAYAGSGEDFDLRAAVQSAGSPDISSVRSTIIEATKHVAEGGGNVAPSSFTQTKVTMANYWGSRDRYPSTETSFQLFMGDAWAWYNGNAETKAALIEGFYSGAQAYIDGTGASRLTTWHDCAQYYGKKLTFYEGGNSEDGLGANPRQRVLGISKAAQAVVTMPSGHGWRTGMKALFRDIQGMTEVNNNTYDVTAYDDTTFTINVDSTGFTTFTNGTGASNFSTTDPTLRGVGFAFAQDGVTNGRTVCGQYCMAVSQAAATYLYTQKNLQQHISLSDCEFPSQYMFSGDSVFSGHPPPGYIYTPNNTWDAFEAWSQGILRFQATTS